MQSNVDGSKQRAREVLERLPLDRMPAAARLFMGPLLQAARSAFEAASEEEIHKAAQLATWFAYHAGRYVLTGDGESRQQLLGPSAEEPKE